MNKNYNFKGKIGSITPFVNYSYSPNAIAISLINLKCEYTIMANMNEKLSTLPPSANKAAKIWLWNPGKESPEVRNRGFSGPKNERVSNKMFSKKKQKNREILLLRSQSFSVKGPYHKRVNYVCLTAVWHFTGNKNSDEFKCSAVLCLKRLMWPLDECFSSKRRCFFIELFFFLSKLKPVIDSW